MNLENKNIGIVFVDEFDSNLHDVYLCALLEYLMSYGNGQLCSTTHNVGPMDVLKQNKIEEERKELDMVFSSEILLTNFEVILNRIAIIHIASKSFFHIFAIIFYASDFLTFVLFISSCFVRIMFYCVCNSINFISVFACICSVI